MEVTSVNGIKNRTKVPYILMIVVLIILAGSRIEQGADYLPYLRLYMSANQFVRWENVFDTDIEPTYVIISKILGKFRMPFPLLLLTYAIISLTLRSITFYKFSPYPFLTLLFYFMPFYFFQDMGHIRQGAAISLCVFSYKYIAEKKILKYLLLVLLAYYFHKTSIIFLPAYWIANTFVSTTKSFLVLLASIAISPLKPYNWFGNLFQSLSADTLRDAFVSYQSLDELSFSAGDIIKIIFIIIIFLFDKRNVETHPDPNYMKIRNLVIMYFCLYYAFRGNLIFSARLPTVYEAFLGILLALIIKNSKDAISKYGLYIYIVIYIYLMSIRYWENARKLNFDRFSNIFTIEQYNNRYFTPQRLID